jgi:hypothetical protein
VGWLSSLKGLNEAWAMILAALITAVATIAAVVVASNLNNPSPANMADTSPTPATPQPTVSVSTPVPAVTGPFDVTVIYGGQESLTIRLNEESYLHELVLETPDWAESLSAGFESLAVTGYVGEAGMCLRYVSEASDAVVPRACRGAIILEHELTEADIFWYDNRQNQFKNIAVKQSGELIGLCPHDSGGGSCDFSAE